MWQLTVERGPAAGLWLLALAAQMSGYSNTAIALALVGGAVFFFLAPVCHHCRKWHVNRRNTGLKTVEPWHLILGGMSGVVIFALVALAGVIWQWRGAPLPASPATLPAANTVETSPPPKPAPSQPSRPTYASITPVAPYIDPNHAYDSDIIKMIDRPVAIKITPIENHQKLLIYLIPADGNQIFLKEITDTISGIAVTIPIMYRLPPKFPNQVDFAWGNPEFPDPHPMVRGNIQKVNVRIIGPNKEEDKFSFSIFKTLFEPGVKQGNEITFALQQN